MKKITVFICVAAFFSFCLAATAQADELSELKAELKALKTRVSELETKLTAQEGKLQKQAKEVKKTKQALIEYEPGEGVSIEPAGLNITADATFVTQMAIDPNTARGDNEITDATYSADIMIEKEFDDCGKAFMQIEGGDGSGLDADEITTFGAVNQDTNDTNNRLEITKVGYEHYLFDNQLTLTGGKIDAGDYMDQNTIACDECTQFLAGGFKHSNALEFPDGNPYGFRALITPETMEWLEVEGGIFDDNDDWEDIFEDLFSFAQVNIKPNLLDRPGNYRAYFWFDDAKHTKWSDPGTTTQVNFGAGTSIDQQLTDDLTAFARFGWEDPDVSTVEWAWSTGFQFEGTTWKRENDYIGFAIGMDIPSGDYEDAGNYGDPEGHIEAYYNFYVNEHLAIAPDYQLIWNPNGNDNEDPINIIGIRGQLDF